MDFLKELLGFVALSGPLLLIIIWLPVAIWLAKKSVNRIELKSVKIGGGLLVFLLIFLIPFADGIVGRIYLSHLCATEAGVKVYQTVELSAEYWDNSGHANFLNTRGVLNKKLVNDKFQWKRIQEPYIDGFIKIDRRSWQLKDQKAGKVIGEKIAFIQKPGWLTVYLSPGPHSSKSCPDETVKDRVNFFLKIFKNSTHN